MLFQGLFKSLYESQVLIVDALLKLFNVKVSISTIDQTLQEHPDYPSFLSIADSLSKWNIESIAIQTTADKLPEIPTPFITTYKTGAFVAVKQMIGSEIVIINQYGKEESISINTFLQSWTEQILVVETNNYSGEQGYQQKMRIVLAKSLIISFIPLSIVTIVLLPFINGTTALLPTMYLMVKLIGLTATLLLLWYDIDKGNPLLKQICSGIQKANCSAVLNTKAASLGGIITWSEIGFIYFAGSLLFTAFAGINVVFPVLSLFSLFAVPYIIFSIYYQWKIAKQWCVLCLLVQAALFSEGLIVAMNSVVSIDAIKNIISNYLFLAVLAITIPAALWFLIKPLLERLQVAKYEKRSYLQLKYNEEVFWSILQKQPSVINYPSDGLGITIGNPNARHTIIKVCNPYCGPCALAHPELEKIIQQNSDIKARIIFFVSEDERDFRAKPVRHFLAIDAMDNAELTNKVLDEWYLAGQKDYNTFAAKYPMNGELKKQSDKISKMRQWCDRVNIKYTPTIFVNGYELPGNYKISDINYFLS